MRGCGCTAKRSMTSRMPFGKSDMIVIGQDAGQHPASGHLTDDKFFDRTFDFMSNPPFGIDWKAAQEDVQKEALIPGSLVLHGLPRSVTAQCFPVPPGQQDAPCL